MALTSLERIMESGSKKGKTDLIRLISILVGCLSTYGNGKVVFKQEQLPKADPIILPGHVYAYTQETADGWIHELITYVESPA